MRKEYIENLKRWASCSGKVKHTNMQSAEEAANKLNKQGIKATVYFCHYCRHYHIGTNK